MEEVITNIVWNEKFIDKFNEAVKELEGDRFGLITFAHTVMESFDTQARGNNVPLKKLVETSLNSYLERKKRHQEHS